MRNPVSLILAAAFTCGILSATAHADDAAAKAQVDKAHAEIWRRFVDPYNLVLDYCDLDGSIIRPTPEDCREMKPSALSWGVPVEDGPMFNGLYLDALCTRWKLTKDEEARDKAKRLIDGLLFVSSVGKTPGFVARGVATDGKTTYPMGSNDQTTPWLYGIWRYVQDGLVTGEERDKLVTKFVEMGNILEQNGWKMPCEGGPSKYRGNFTKPGWEGAPRLVFITKAMHYFTKDKAWHEKYLAALNEKIGVISARGSTSAARALSSIPARVPGIPGPARRVSSACAPCGRWRRNPRCATPMRRACETAPRSPPRASPCARSSTPRARITLSMTGG